MEKVYGYARVSTREQNLDRQIAALRQYVTDERDIITDKESGKDFDRTGYQYLRERLIRPGDTLIVKSLDRLGRNKEQVMEELRHFRADGVRVKILDLPTTMIDLPDGQDWIVEMVNNILIEVLASIAEQERLTIRQRQAEGIAEAKKQGRLLGRKKTELPAEWELVTGLWKSGSITAVQAMDRLGLKKSTFYRMVREQGVD
nr:MAG TPA: gamma delta Resolvase, site specific recombination [Caudoviricetes sp.]